MSFGKDGLCTSIRGMVVPDHVDAYPSLFHGYGYLKYKLEMKNGSNILS